MNSQQPLVDIEKFTFQNLFIQGKGIQITNVPPGLKRSAVTFFREDTFTNLSFSWAITIKTGLISFVQMR